MFEFEKVLLLHYRTFFLFALTFFCNSLLQDAPLYENIEVISKFSPVPKPRKSSPLNDDAKSFVRFEKPAEPSEYSG